MQLCGRYGCCRTIVCSSMLVWDVADLIKIRVVMWMRTKHDIKLYLVDDFKGYLDGIRSLKL
ncbi:hypothetical protein RHMOL_Rhmol03G0124100 [Rhododendron molle]|uniref:Uncharacterized protein n=1 Tax=Rhododendron molle TaxID=49168 RepID=A0ACC0PD42_RHOML|nr:hypothetical protein RHMOL_Rhmol03G0124100 [Rhododendron molle]